MLNTKESSRSATLRTYKTIFKPTALYDCIYRGNEQKVTGDTKEIRKKDDEESIWVRGEMRVTEDGYVRRTSLRYRASVRAQQ